MAFIREFQVLGIELGPKIGRESRAERIRVEIFKNQRENAILFESGMSYVQAFRKCYGRNAELRAIKRDPIGRPTHVATDDELFSDDDDETIV